MTLTFLVLKGEIAAWIANFEKLAIMGVGNPFRQDDAIGLQILDNLKGKTPSNVKLFKCDMVPENYLEEIESFNPTHVLIVDAAQIGDKPGESILFPPEEVKGYLLSTHAISLSVLAEIIKESLGAKVAFIGVQPERTNFGECLSPALQYAAKQITQTIIDLIRT